MPATTTRPASPRRCSPSATSLDGRWTPEQRELRYRIVRALRTATKGRVPAAEIEELIESVPKMGLRLRAPGRVEIVGVEAPDQPSRRAS